MRYESLMLELGKQAPYFALPDSAGKIHALDDFAGAQGLLVAFFCNHCPFVQHIAGQFAAFAAEYQPKGLQVVAISSNDRVAHPEDGPVQMGEFAAKHGFRFPYLYDESQDVALAFGAVCTPDCFMYDGDRRLFYRGQFDSSRPVTPYFPERGIPVTGGDMRAAADALLAGKPAPSNQTASQGCSMKWKAGKEPAWG
jgi:peroxiredoxin